MKNTNIYLFLSCKILFVSSIEFGLKDFDDTILYSINWPGVLSDVSGHAGDVTYNDVLVQTDAQEKFTCKIPQLVEKEKDENEKYTGPNPIDLLSDLFSQSSCSYKLEAYWTYELCHGKFIRQYHEEREGKKVKIQEYFLGKWDEKKQALFHEQLESEEKTKPNTPAPVKKIDGLNMPYIQLNMSDGTMCDLNGRPRMTNVLYVCYTHGKHEVYSLKETSICEYEMIVLSPLLCSHPRYRPQASGENIINCIPSEGTGTKPKSLLQLEAESAKLRQQFYNDDSRRKVFAVIPIKEVDQNGVPGVRLQLLPFNEVDENELTVGHRMVTPKGQPPSAEAAAFNDFVTGRDCIQGGSGWWKYEFCFGKSVSQYHVDKENSKTVVNLGNFVKSAHLKWLESHPHKRPLVGSQVSYLYTNGDHCEETGKARQTEVKLKCVENLKSPGAVSLYLLEPKTCQYILGVESQVICRLLEKVDNDGLPITEETIGFSRASFENGYSSPKYGSIHAAQGPDSKKKKNTREEVKITVVLADDGNHIADGDE